MCEPGSRTSGATASSAARSCRRCSSARRSRSSSRPSRSSRSRTTTTPRVAGLLFGDVRPARARQAAAARDRGLCGPRRAVLGARAARPAGRHGCGDGDRGLREPDVERAVPRDAHSARAAGALPEGRADDHRVESGDPAGPPPRSEASRRSTSSSPCRPCSRTIRPSRRSAPASHPASTPRSRRRGPPARTAACARYRPPSLRRARG